MIDCEQVLQELSNYLDSDVTEQLRQQIEEHIHSCGNCKVLVDTTRETLQLVAGEKVLEIPHGVSTRLLERLSVLWK